MKRAQLFSIDLVIAFFMMIIGISFILIYYEDLTYSIDHKLEMQKMQRIANDATHLMLNHPKFLNNFDASGMSANEQIGTIDYKSTSNSLKSQGDFNTGYSFSSSYHEIGAQGYTLSIGSIPQTCGNNIAKSQRIKKDGTLLEVYVC